MIILATTVKILFLYYIHYPDIKADNQFLVPDGVHLNELGNNILLNIIQGAMDQFRNDVALWVNKLRGRYDAIFIEQCHLPLHVTL
jgi:hypothetical protein